jgi:hypothetical protein
MTTPARPRRDKYPTRLKTWEVCGELPRRDGDPFKVKVRAIGILHAIDLVSSDFELIGRLTAAEKAARYRRRHRTDPANL